MPKTEQFSSFFNAVSKFLIPQNREKARSYPR